MEYFGCIYICMGYSVVDEWNGVDKRPATVDLLKLSFSALRARHAFPCYGLAFPLKVGFACSW